MQEVSEWIVTTTRDTGTYTLAAAPDKGGQPVVLKFDREPAERLASALIDIYGEPWKVREE